MPVIIVSADHDFHQLVTERVGVYDDVKKQLWDIEAVTNHYQLAVQALVARYGLLLLGDWLTRLTELTWTLTEWMEAADAS